MTHWYTSDWHIGHANIIRYCERPFFDTNAMTESLIARFNERVGSDDTTTHVGDFSLSEKLVEPVLRRLHGTHRLVVGNHDACHPCHKKHRGATDRYRRYGFSEVLTEEIVGPFRVSHFRVHHMPYQADERHGERYADLRPKDDGLWLVHGHVHSKPGQRVRRSMRQIDVGVDAWNYRPVSTKEILEIIGA